MKKICIFSTRYYPHIGGVERYTENFARELVRQGNKVTIITCSKLENREERLIEGMDVLRIKSISLLNGRYLIPYIFDVKKLLKSLEKTKWDQIIINTRFYPLSLMAASWGDKQKIDTIVIEHGSNYLTFNSAILDKIIVVYEKIITFLMKRYKLEFAGVSKAAVQWLKEFNIIGTRVIYNGIDHRNLDKIIKETYRYDGEKIRIGFIGRLVKEKGILNLLDVCSALAKENIPFELIVAGEGPLEKDIIDYQGKNLFCNYIGTLSHEEVIRELVNIDIFVLDSKSEGLPTILLEAGYCECALVGSNRGGIPEIIDSNNGYLIEYNNREQLYDTLKSLIQSKDLSRALSKNAKKKVEKAFIWEKIINNI